MRIVDTSCLYRTKPMYVEDQNDFVNGACELETSLEPLALLDRLQGIEQRLGRVKKINKGPRNIDLDIIGYQGQTIREERLIVPHALLHERAFVLRPLCDLQHGRSWVVPTSQRSASDHLNDLNEDMQSMTVLGSEGASLAALDPKRRTLLMSILNVTPDSFSDEGRNFTKSFDRLQQIVTSHIAAGADIIDIGGQSSRPNAADISADEEIERVLPAIEAVKALPEAKDIVISVDTYRATVAEAAVNAGAHIVNDISAGLLDDAMLSTVARLGCTYAMMHMRGTPATMSSKENCTYPSDVTHVVADELEDRLNAALDAGIRRWRLILDPGIGFAKDLSGNLALLRRLGELRQDTRFHGMPWLVGSSKKKFIGTVTGVTDASDRNWGTAATVTAAIAGGADIVRVHDVEPMLSVVKMADAIYRA
ncbi:hypothetical protein AMS68_006737 [Peltaster fructicola]|uniref:Folic acid synthesis protein FOL1 n=1 Tax=Peltaster fructicola TaxID=286661 RepID=A0A6H0Y3L2_9PEZI|nr:hypothetical protein AMS68_006737 [Peltaster fructicola]